MHFFLSLGKQKRTSCLSNLLSRLIYSAGTDDVVQEHYGTMTGNNDTHNILAQYLS